MTIKQTMKSWLKLRIISLTIVSAFVMLAVTVHDMIKTKQKFDDYLISKAIAEDKKASEETKEDSGDDKKVDKADKSDQKTVEADEAKADDVEDKEDKKEDDKAKDENPNVSTKAPEDILKKREFSQIELDLLQSLSQRREEIESYAKEVSMRENLLSATEKRIDEKIKKMTTLQNEVQLILEEYKKQDETELKSLVKIYESMKPKDAARIFNEMEMEIMLQVVDRMSERKAAPVLAAMNPSKAKDLTVELAAMRRLRKEKTEGMLDQNGSLATYKEAESTQSNPGGKGQPPEQ